MVLVKVIILKCCYIYNAYFISIMQELFENVEIIIRSKSEETSKNLEKF